MNQQTGTHPLPEFGVNVAVLPARGLRVLLEPDLAERQILAREADVVSVTWFKAELLFKRWHKNGVSVTGEVRAGLVQACAVTLDPVETLVAETVERLFAPKGSKLARPRLDQDGEWVINHEGPDIPDTFIGDTIDAWEIALEHFLLGVDPFVRKEGAEFETNGPGAKGAANGDRARENPFAALKGLISKDDE